MAPRRPKLRARIGVFALVTAAFSFAALGPARQALEQRRAIELEEQKLSALKTTNSDLEEDLARLNDREYLEKAAREQMGLVKPGEISYIVERPPVDDLPEARPPEPDPWYRQAWDWVLSRF